MRLRSGLGIGVLVMAVVAAVAVLRTHSLPPPIPPDPIDSASIPIPVVDARARQLTAAFRDTTVLPATVQFDDDPAMPVGFVFRRFTETNPSGYGPQRYTANGLLVRATDGAVLDTIEVDVWPNSRRRTPAADLVRCEQDNEFGGDTCTQASGLPPGTAAMVMSDPAFARTAPSDSPTGSPPGLTTQLQAGYPDGTVLTITVDSVAQAGIPLDNAAMIRLATLPGIAGG